MVPDPASPLQPFPDAPLPAVRPGMCLRRTEEAAYQHLGDETVVVLPMTRTLHVINQTGRMLWDLMDSPKKVSELVDRLVEDFDVDRAHAEADVLAWVSELLRQHILVETDVQKT